MNEIDWIGSIGVGLILLAYFLRVIKIINTSDLLFILLNLVGAGIACFASFLIEYIPFIILEGAWTLISLFTLFNYLRLKYERRTKLE